VLKFISTTLKMQMQMQIHIHYPDSGADSSSSSNSSFRSPGVQESRTSSVAVRISKSTTHNTFPPPLNMEEGTPTHPPTHTHSLDSPCQIQDADLHPPPLDAQARTLAQVVLEVSPSQLDARPLLVVEAVREGCCRCRCRCGCGGGNVGA